MRYRISCGGAWAVVSSKERADEIAALWRKLYPMFTTTVEEIE